MNLTQKLKSLERQIVFMRWGTSAEFGKIKYVGIDFVEFQVIDSENADYLETVIINPNLILEIILGGPDVGRVIAEFSSNLPSSCEE